MRGEIVRGQILAFGLVLGALAPGGAARANGYEVLYHFCSLQNCTDGRWPYAGLIADDQGNLYGTTGAGGKSPCRLYGCGTVFKLAPDGKETVLHAFTAGYDGSGPYGGLIADAQGNLYGTTATGGSANCGGLQYGCGTVFKVTAKGKESVLYAFGGNSDGAYPLAGLVADASGNLYGTTEYGGGGTNCIVQFGGCGTVFKVAPDGTETVLFAFGGGSDGAYPQAGLMLDEKGDLYGTTAYGGNAGSNCTSGETTGCGVIFKLAANGSESTLYEFQGGSDGETPLTSLVKDRAGNLFGTTQAGAGGCSPVGCGTIFEFSPDRVETTIYDFTGGNDGAHPSAGLVLDKKHDVYGTTYSGGSDDEGTVFKLTAGHKLSVLNTFTGDGDASVAPLIVGDKVFLFGTTEFGPAGTVFKVKK